MHRRPLIALAAVAALAVGLSGRSLVNEFDGTAEAAATTVNSENTWTAGTWCNDRKKDGGRFDIEGVGVSWSASSVEMVLVVRTLPTFEKPAAAIVTFADGRGHRTGSLRTTWAGHGAEPTASIVDATGRRRALLTTPTVLRGTRTITTTIPARLIDRSAGTRAWTIRTTLGGDVQDTCRPTSANGPRPGPWLQAP